MEFEKLYRYDIVACADINETAAIHENAFELPRRSLTTQRSSFVNPRNFKLFCWDNLKKIIFANMFEGIKSKLVNSRLDAMYAGRERIVKSCGLSAAEKIGILYEASEQRQFDIVRRLMQVLQTKIPYVRSLGFVDSKELADFHIQPLEYSFFCRRDLNWYGLPSELAVSEFVNAGFDILLCLNIEEKIPLTYVMAASDAGFKVGLYSEQNAKILDVMLRLNEENLDMEELSKQIIYYLENIRYE